MQRVLARMPEPVRVAGRRQSARRHEELQNGFLPFSPPASLGMEIRNPLCSPSPINGETDARLRLGHRGTQRCQLRQRVSSFLFFFNVLLLLLPADWLWRWVKLGLNEQPFVYGRSVRAGARQTSRG